MNPRALLNEVGHTGGDVLVTLEDEVLTIDTHHLRMIPDEHEG